MSVPPAASAAPAQVAPRAGLALALLLSINLFNYIDRQVLAAVLPKLELDANLFNPTDPNLKFKLGSLTTAFFVTYMLLSPVFGRLGDTWSRWTLVGLAVIVWSLASGGSGLATGFWVLLLTRCFVGVGEAAYGPIAPAMLSDLYPERRRGKIMAWFYMAIPVGSALGYVLGATVSDTALGWRGAFQVVVLPGLILGALCFFMREPGRARGEIVRSEPYGQVLRELKGIRSFVLCSAGMTCTTFVLGGVGVWAPYYFFYREARFQITPEAIDELAAVRTTAGEPAVPEEVIARLRRLRPLAGPNPLDAAGLRAALGGVLTPAELQQHQGRIFEAMTAPGSKSLTFIGTVFGGILVVGGLVATLFGGWLGDKLRDRVRGSYFLVCGWGAIVALPAFVAMLFVPFPYAWIFVFVAIFFLFINTGPANTILANVTRHQIRATAFAVNILIIHALGDVISPPLIGLIADRSSLRNALLIVSVLILVAGVLWNMGARYLDEETRRVSEAAAGAKPSPHPAWGRGAGGERSSLGPAETSPPNPTLRSGEGG
jgi:MFS transporter, Spinster family, sphingosine-1-phosphate transporter